MCIRLCRHVGLWLPDMKGTQSTTCSVGLMSKPSFGLEWHHGKAYLKSEDRGIVNLGGYGRKLLVQSTYVLIAMKACKAPCSWLGYRA